MTEADIARLPRWTIKEPNHKEFQIFKRDFLMRKSQTDEVKQLMRYIGELQSEIDELKHSLAHVQKMSPEEYKEFLVEMSKLEDRAKNPKIRKKKLLDEIERMRKVLITNNLTWK